MNKYYFVKYRWSVYEWFEYPYTYMFNIMRELKKLVSHILVTMNSDLELVTQGRNRHNYELIYIASYWIQCPRELIMSTFNSFLFVTLFDIYLSMDCGGHKSEWWIDFILVLQLSLKRNHMSNPNNNTTGYCLRILLLSYMLHNGFICKP